MPVETSDLWTPEQWASAIAEQALTRVGLLNRDLGVVTRGRRFDEAASGPGELATIGAWKDITDQDDDEQVEDEAPENDEGQSALLLAVPVLNRVTMNSFAALALQVALGARQEKIQDPPALAQIVARRLAQRQRTLIAILRGIFGSGFQTQPTCSLSALRFDYHTEDVGEEVAEANMLTFSRFVEGKAALGELESEVVAFVAHPDLLAAMQKREAAEEGAGNRESLFSDGKLLGARIIPSNDLVRDGGTSGRVFDSYLLTRSCVAMGEMPQLSGKQAEAHPVDVASLSIAPLKGTNNFAVYDRTRFFIAPLGVSYAGSAQPTNYALSSPISWTLKFSEAKRCGAVCFRSNL